MTNRPHPSEPTLGIEEFDGTDDVVMPDHVRRAAEERIEAAVRKYGRTEDEGTPK